MSEHEFKSAVAANLRERTGLTGNDVNLDEHIHSMYGRYVEREDSPDEIVDDIIRQRDIYEIS